MADFKARVTFTPLQGRLDKNGKPIQQKLKPGEDARTITYRLTRDNIQNGSGDFIGVVKHLL